MLGAKQKTNNTYPHLSLTLGIKSGPHSWEAIALITVPPPVLLRPYFGLNIVFNFAHDSGVRNPWSRQNLVSF